MSSAHAYSNFTGLTPAADGVGREEGRLARGDSYLTEIQRHRWRGPDDAAQYLRLDPYNTRDNIMSGSDDGGAYTTDSPLPELFLDGADEEREAAAFCVPDSTSGVDSSYKGIVPIPEAMHGVVVLNRKGNHAIPRSIRGAHFGGVGVYAGGYRIACRGPAFAAVRVCPACLGELPTGRSEEAGERSEEEDVHIPGKRRADGTRYGGLFCSCGGASAEEEGEDATRNTVASHVVVDGYLSIADCQEALLTGSNPNICASDNATCNGSNETMKEESNRSLDSHSSNSSNNSDAGSNSSSRSSRNGRSRGNDGGSNTRIPIDNLDAMTRSEARRRGGATLPSSVYGTVDMTGTISIRRYSLGEHSRHSGGNSFGNNGNRSSIMASSPSVPPCPCRSLGVRAKDLDIFYQDLLATGRSGYWSINECDEGFGEEGEEQTIEQHAAHIFSRSTTASTVAEAVDTADRDRAGTAPPPLPLRTYLMASSIVARFSLPNEQESLAPTPSSSSVRELLKVIPNGFLNHAAWQRWWREREVQEAESDAVYGRGRYYSEGESWDSEGGVVDRDDHVTVQDENAEERNNFPPSAEETYAESDGANDASDDCTLDDWVDSVDGSDEDGAQRPTISFIDGAHRPAREPSGRLYSPTARSSSWFGAVSQATSFLDSNRGGDSTYQSKEVPHGMEEEDVENEDAPDRHASFLTDFPSLYTSSCSLPSSLGPFTAPATVDSSAKPPTGCPWSYGNGATASGGTTASWCGSYTPMPGRIAYGQPTNHTNLSSRADMHGSFFASPPPQWQQQQQQTQSGEGHPCHQRTLSGMRYDGAGGAEQPHRRWTIPLSCRQGSGYQHMGRSFFVSSSDF